MDKLLVDACAQMNIELSAEQTKQFLEYKDLLLEWNEKMNLTAITEDREVILKHFVDSLTLLPYVKMHGKSVIDVGTGAGFPGIPVKIAVPEVKLTLLDSLNKRIKFLEEVCDKLGLKGVDCIHSRAEDGGRNKSLREKFDFCVSRAVANLSVLSEYDLPFVKIGGQLIALKGPSGYEEAEGAKKAIKLLGGEISDIKEVGLPYTDIKHTIIFINKIKQTPTRYPRKAGTITKDPII